MNDSIEQQIARLDLPDASNQLDRRIDDLFRSRPSRHDREPRHGSTAIALACGTVAAVLLVLMLPGGAPTPELSTNSPTAVVNVDVAIPLLNAPEKDGDPNEPILLAPESLVVTTETNEGDEQ